MKKRSIFFLIRFLTLYLLVFLTKSQAQRADLLLVNSQKIETAIYKGIEGSPYMFKTWQLGEIRNTQEGNAPIKNVQLNYNGFTQSFEVKKGNQFIALDEKWYPKVTLISKKKGEIHPLNFESGLHPKREKHFFRMVFQGETFYVIEDFKVHIIDRVKQEYGKQKKIRKFAGSNQYYFIAGEKATPFKLKMKSILKTLNPSKAIEQFKNNNKLSWDTETNLLILLEVYNKERMLIGKKADKNYSKSEISINR